MDWDGDPEFRVVNKSVTKDMKKVAEYYQNRGEGEEERHEEEFAKNLTHYWGIADGYPKADVPEIGELLTNRSIVDEWDMEGEGGPGINLYEFLQDGREPIVEIVDEPYPCQRETWPPELPPETSFIYRVGPPGEQRIPGLRGHLGYNAVVRAPLTRYAGNEGAVDWSFQYVSVVMVCKKKYQ